MSTVDEPLVFQQTVEGLLRALGPELTRTVSPRLKEAGIDPGHLLPAYPLPAWLAALDVSAEALSPGVPREQAMYRLGRRFMEGYASTLLGRALLGMMRVLGPARVVYRMTRNFRTANNYTETRLMERSGRHYELWCSQVSNPDFYRGLLEAGLEHAGAQHPAVELDGRPDGGALFHVRWQ